MSELRANRRERKQRYLRGLRGEKKAVSPVVATLILILIAVAAAAALYLWLVAWQGNITGGIGQPSAQYTVTIGGSTSVYPFTQAAATWFEQNNSDVTISVNQGGTGAGMLAVCSGNVQVGESSTPQTVTGLQANDGCPQTPGITITTIAYDAVDVIVPSGNTHGLLSINYDTLTYVYDHASTTAATLVATTINNEPVTAGLPAVTVWSNLPAALPGTWGGVLQTQTTGYAIAGSADQAAGTGVLAADIVTPAADASPCGWTICAGPFVATPTAGAGPLAVVIPVERSDASGTTQTFEAKLLGATSSTAFATSFSALGYSGCGSNNLLSDCGISVSTTGNGNPGVISAVAGSANTIGYASDGLVRATGSGVSFVPFLAVGQTLIGTSAASTTAYGAVVPSTGATGTIAAGILDSSTTNQYSGWRPFEMVTLQPPTGEIQRFIEFIVDPANNINIASATGEVSIYSI